MSCERKIFTENSISPEEIARRHPRSGLLARLAAAEIRRFGLTDVSDIHRLAIERGWDTITVHLAISLLWEDQHMRRPEDESDRRVPA